jgi:hypothetical protein
MLPIKQYFLRSFCRKKIPPVKRFEPPYNGKIEEKIKKR